MARLSRTPLGATMLPLAFAVAVCVSPAPAAGGSPASECSLHVLVLVWVVCVSARAARVCCWRCRRGVEQASALCCRAAFRRSAAAGVARIARACQAITENHSHGAGRVCCRCCARAWPAHPRHAHRFTRASPAPGGRSHLQQPRPTCHVCHAGYVRWPCARHVRVAGGHEELRRRLRRLHHHVRAPRRASGGTVPDWRVLASVLAAMPRWFATAVVVLHCGRRLALPRLV